jgi:DNA-3-methyladenine glycosylase II
MRQEFGKVRRSGSPQAIADQRWGFSSDRTVSAQPRKSPRCQTRKYRGVRLTDPATYPNGLAFDDADRRLAGVDSVMATLIGRLGPIELPVVESPPDLFGSLIMAIVRQQLATAAAVAIFRRLVAYFGGSVPTPAALISAGTDLRTTVGLSHAKEHAIRSLAEQVDSGDLDLDGLHSRPDEEVRRSLTAVPGIGPWTAGVFMMFRLDRQDVLLAGDLGIRKGAQITYHLDHLPTPKAIEVIAAPWRPYRTRGCLYLWAAVRDVR